jgi:hypothetical protein
MLNHNGQLANSFGHQKGAYTLEYEHQRQCCSKILPIHSQPFLNGAICSSQNALNLEKHTLKPSRLFGTKKPSERSALEREYDNKALCFALRLMALIYLKPQLILLYSYA